MAKTMARYKMKRAIESQGNAETEKLRSELTAAKAVASMLEDSVYQLLEMLLAEGIDARLTESYEIEVRPSEKKKKKKKGDEEDDIPSSPVPF